MRGLPAENEQLIYKVQGDNDDIIIKGYLMFELDGKKTIEVDGEKHECYVLTCYGEGTISYYYRFGMNWTVSGDEYHDAETFDTVMYTMNFTTSMALYFGGMTTTTNESVVVPLSRNTTWDNDTDPDVGDSWITTTYTRETTKETTDGEVVSSGTTYETSVKNYDFADRVTVTVDAGTFDCDMIVSYPVNTTEPDNTVVFDYYDHETNIPVKTEFYDNGSLVMEMELTDEIPEYEAEVFEPYPVVYEPDDLPIYIDDEEDWTPPYWWDDGSELENTEESGGTEMENTGLIITALVVFFVVIFVAILVVVVTTLDKRHERYSVSPVPMPPPMVTYYQCPGCGQNLHYINEHKRWYCWTCKKYQD